MKLPVKGSIYAKLGWLKQTITKVKIIFSFISGYLTNFSLNTKNEGTPHLQK